MQMKRMTLIIVLAVLGVSGAASSASSATTLCVRAAPGCYATVQAAVDAAQSGDTIAIAAGTYAGGVTIDKSVTIVGAGARQTTIKGGGPVVTIGVPFEPNTPTVSIRGVTITGGVATRDGDNLFAALGGGIYIQIGADFGRGATVTIADSVVTRNRALPSATVPDGTFALAEGAGIDSFGDLHLIDTQVTDNEGGSGSGQPSIATEADAGGIYNHIQAALTLDRSIVSGNHSRVTGANDGSATSGGIFSLGELAIRHSIIADNTSELRSTAPSSVEQAALAGGIQVSFCPVEFCGPPHSATITDSIVHGNRAVARVENPGGLAVAFAGGIQAEGPLDLERSSVTDNLARASSTGDAAADGGGIEIDGPATIRDTVVARNSVQVDAAGAALAQGGGIANAGQVVAERLLVVGNSVLAKGTGGQLPFGAPSAAQGGGIWNGSFGSDAPTQLTLTASAVLHNSAGASPGAGFLVQGGGVYTDVPVMIAKTAIAGNKPDQCFGC
jgi:hypothetical protein